jgi:hypothetical protein
MRALSAGRQAGASARAVGDPGLAQIIGRHLDGHLVSAQDADVVLSHLSRDMRSYDVSVFQLDAEHGVGKRLDYGPFHFNMFFLRHKIRFLPLLMGELALHYTRKARDEKIDIP